MYTIPLRPIYHIRSTNYIKSTHHVRFITKINRQNNFLVRRPFPTIKSDDFVSNNNHNLLNNNFKISNKKYYLLNNNIINSYNFITKQYLPRNSGNSLSNYIINNFLTKSPRCSKNILKNNLHYSKYTQSSFGLIFMLFSGILFFWGLIFFLFTLQVIVSLTLFYPGISFCIFAFLCICWAIMSYIYE